MAQHLPPSNEIERDAHIMVEKGGTKFLILDFLVRSIEHEEFVGKLMV